MGEVPEGYCHCGCGNKTNLADRTDLSKGYLKDKPIQYLLGHKFQTDENKEKRSGSKSRFWNGGKTKSPSGHAKTLVPNHPRADKYGYVFDHVLIAQKALGKPLPPKAQVHHHTPKQLVVCQDQKYHSLLHRRKVSYESCGHASWRKCPYCKNYDAPENLFIRNDDSQAYHRKCKRKYDNDKYACATATKGNCISQSKGLD